MSETPGVVDSLAEAEAEALPEDEEREALQAATERVMSATTPEVADVPKQRLTIDDLVDVVEYSAEGSVIMSVPRSGGVNKPMHLVGEGKTVDGIKIGIFEDQDGQKIAPLNIVKEMNDEERARTLQKAVDNVKPKSPDLGTREATLYDPEALENKRFNRAEVAGEVGEQAVEESGVAEPDSAN